MKMAPKLFVNYVYLFYFTYWRKCLFFTLQAAGTIGQISSHVGWASQSISSI
jgi:hypothetical protein